VRIGFWAVGALVFGAFIAHFVLEDKGYVLITLRGYVVEMSVPGLLVLLVAAYFLVRFAVGVWRAPAQLGTKLAQRRSRASGTRLTRGLMELTAGNWARGERLLTRSISGGDAPLVNYLMAARAAQKQGAVDRRNDWLKLAFEELPDAEAAILVTQAELQIDNQEYEAALASLRRLDEKQPNNSVGIGLLARVYQLMDDRAGLLELLPKLGTAQLDPKLKESLAASALEAAAETADFSLEQLNAHWSALATPLQQSPRLQAWRARQLNILGDGARAESEVRKALKRSWQPDLVEVYGEIETAQRSKQLKQAEAWLKDHADDSGLLLTAARLCIASELWGKARSYLETSLAIEPDPGAYAIYGKLLSQMGETEAAADAYRRGLSLVSHTELDMPALNPPTFEAD